MSATRDLIYWLIVNGGADTCSVCVYNRDGECHARNGGEGIRCLRSCRVGMTQYFRRLGEEQKEEPKK